VAVQEVITLTLAHYVHGDQMSSVNMIGLMVCMSGICFHVYTKANKRVTIAPTTSAADVKRLRRHTSSERKHRRDAKFLQRAFLSDSDSDYADNAFR
jgi:hypothetical protein